MFKREIRYLVLKNKDILAALNNEEFNTLVSLAIKVRKYREKAGKPY